jgi:hypothetical protein
MFGSYSPTVRRQLLAKHFLISTLPERALDDLVKFSTIAHFAPHQEIVRKGDSGDCLSGLSTATRRSHRVPSTGGLACSF